MAEIADITPLHSPVALARDMEDAAKNATAGFYVLVNEDDSLTYEMAGMHRKDILWALVKMQKEITE